MFYDFHMHSALSPCASEDMTPNNIVNMSLINGLDCIAVTDHNSCKNLRAILEVAKDTELLVVCGMEVTTAEEVHVVCLFPDIDAAERMEEILRAHWYTVPNKPDTFGVQAYMDTEDNVTGFCRHLLVTATDLGIYDLVRHTAELGGIAIPAHVDRTSNSLLASLGFLPSDLQVDFVELSKRIEDPVDYMDRNKRRFQRPLTIIRSSDAHYLEDINDAVNELPFPKPSTAAELIGLLKRLGSDACQS